MSFLGNSSVRHLLEIMVAIAAIVIPATLLAPAAVAENDPSQQEVEEEVNKFLEAHNVNVLHMTQSENGEYLSVTLLYEQLAPMSE